jgi:transcriptional regulator with XRE-family HTH domain
MPRERKEPKEKVGDRIRLARVRAGMTQAELAEKAGLAESWIAGAERYRPEKPDLDAYLRPIASATGVSVSYLSSPMGVVPIDEAGGAHPADQWIIGFRGDQSIPDEAKEDVLRIVERLRNRPKP